MATAPGDGKTSPFGNGQGQASGANAMPNDFTKTPGGNAGSRTPPRDFLTGRAQSAGSDPIDSTTAAPGPRTAAEAASPPPGRPGGVGTIGNGAKPFRVG